MTGPDKCLSILEQTPAILANLLSGASIDDLQWRPAPERWSISMVLAHLADVEVKGFRSRFEAMATQQEPFLASYDQGALFRSGGTFDAQAELAAFRDLRADNLRWIRGVPADAYARTGKHEEFGTISFEQLLNEFAFHDLGHIRQIMELYRSRAFYPNMGSFQSIYRINP
jgi:DinB superfamily